MWGSYENYRRDHLLLLALRAYSRCAGRVTLPNWMPHVDYLQELKNRIDGRFIFANGARPGRAFCRFSTRCDRVENSLRDLETRMQLDFARSMAATKPVACLLNYPDAGLNT